MPACENPVTAGRLASNTIEPISKGVDTWERREKPLAATYCPGTIMRNRRQQLVFFFLMLGGVQGWAGCGSGEGDAPGQAGGTAGTPETVPSGGTGEAGRTGGTGSVGEAGQTGMAGQAGGVVPSSGGGTSSGGKTTGGSTGTSGSGGTSGSARTSGNSDMASQYVNAINAVRAAVTKPDNYTGTWTPLPDVTWSETVAASAQTWANNLAANQNCGLQHESQNKYGENLAKGTNLTPKQAVDMWASEKSLYTWSSTYSMADFDAGSGHYTQLVWRKSTQVGCGSATCARVVVISCRFSPPGNVIGQPAY